MRLRFWQRRKRSDAVEQERRQVRQELQAAEDKIRESERRILQIELEMQEDIMKQQRRASRDYFNHERRRTHE